MRSNVIFRNRLHRGVAKVRRVTNRLQNALKSDAQDSQDYKYVFPPVQIESNLDWLLVELPPRYTPQFPYGLEHVYTILKSLELKTQVMDINIRLYHDYHATLSSNDDVYDGAIKITTEEGFIIGDDPWESNSIDNFKRDDVLSFFWPQIQEIIDQIAEKKPKFVGISVNVEFSEVYDRFVKELRKCFPEVTIVVGGYLCATSTIGAVVLKDFDYMLIGEAEGVLPAFATALKNGESTLNMPGILSKQDAALGLEVKPVYIDNWHTFGFPKYEWADLRMYNTAEDYLMLPISASRGCVWAKCRFCAECIVYRIRPAPDVIEELEYFKKRGVRNFHFNESDINGDPKQLTDICTAIIEAGVHVNLFAQLRIHKKSTLDYFKHLKSAGFGALRFGVDGWSNRLLRMQKKGYNMRLVHENLRDCHKAGIEVHVNILTGIPGETEEDVEDTIAAVVEIYKKSKFIIISLNHLCLLVNSFYFSQSDELGVKFRGDKHEIQKVHGNIIPGHLWYSNDPYIDHNIRLDRLKRVYEGVLLNKVPVDAWSLKWVSSKLWAKIGDRYNDPNRSLRLDTSKKPSKIDLVYENKFHKFYSVDNRFIAIDRSLRKINPKLERFIPNLHESLLNEKLGNRTLLPYIVVGSSSDKVSEIIQSSNLKLANFTIVQYKRKFVGVNRLLDPIHLGEFLVAWDLYPWVVGEDNIMDLIARLNHDVNINPETQVRETQFEEIIDRQGIEIIA